MLEGIQGKAVEFFSKLFNQSHIPPSFREQNSISTSWSQSRLSRLVSFKKIENVIFSTNNDKAFKPELFNEGVEKCESKLHIDYLIYINQEKSKLHMLLLSTPSKYKNSHPYTN